MDDELRLALSDAIAILKEARELITDPSHWVRSAFATYANGRHCSEFDRNAVCFCAKGAVNRVSMDRVGLEYSRRHDALNEIDKAVAETQEILGTGIKSIISINDEKGHHATLEAMDAAIVYLEKQLETA